jgi:diguanylate cyclase (GGDEF)-like protein/PAS domain S-box-containing protein
MNDEQYRLLLDASPVGVVLVDAQNPEWPLVYANPGFLAMTGYSREELIGKNLRVLQGGDADPDARQRLRAQLGRGESCHLVLRNYRKDGSAFLNEFSIVPLRDANGQITHYAGYHREAPARPEAAERPRPEPRAAQPPVAREDRLTGLLSYPYLEELLKRDWAIAQREHLSIAIFAIDIDALESYNATFGRAAGDSIIRRLAHCISACLRRASDATARVDGGSLLAFAPGLNIEQALRIGNTMTERVRDLRIHHPRSSVLRYVSISVGVAAAMPEVSDNSADLVQRARQQLEFAKKSGRNHAA